MVKSRRDGKRKKKVHHLFGNVEQPVGPFYINTTEPGSKGWGQERRGTRV